MQNLAIAAFALVKGLERVSHSVNVLELGNMMWRCRSLQL